MLSFVKLYSPVCFHPTTKDYAFDEFESPLSAFLNHLKVLFSIYSYVLSLWQQLHPGITVWTDLNLSYRRMLPHKYKIFWSIGFLEKKRFFKIYSIYFNVKIRLVSPPTTRGSYFEHTWIFNNSLLSPLKRRRHFHLIKLKPFTQWCIVPKLVKISQMVLVKKSKEFTDRQTGAGQNVIRKTGELKT